MRDPERIERIMGLITEIWNKQPDSRFMQLVDNIAWDYSNKNNNAFKEHSYSKWEYEDATVYKKRYC